MARLTVLADCSFSYTPGTSLVALVVLTLVLAPLAHLLQWLVSWCWLIALVLTRLAPLLLLLAVLARVLARLAHLLLLLVVLSRVLARLALLLQWLVTRCWLIALVLARLAPLLLLLVVLTRVLAPLACLLQWLVLQCRLIALVLARLAPLLLLLIVLTHVLAQLGLCVHCVVANCLMIVPNSSLQDWHAFAVDKEPSLLVYNRNEDSFNHAMSIITHCQMKKRMYNNN